MHYSPGSRLGAYEIVSIIGAGGMGEVYRARDERLGRDVAIKVLPEALARDKERLGRFEREARTVGSISHPNILSVYDTGTQDGIPFLVSELLEGQSLRDILGNGPLPRRRACEFALQIAQGLDAAHRKGIVHRDLKPENVYITSDHRVKILDFGLARTVEPFHLGADAPTVAANLTTQSGAVLGTVGYMAPEQVRGVPVDHRADIFSFGVVLYEMLTARRAFQRDSAMETLSSILRDTPPEISTIVPGTPPALERVVERCLEKDPALRFQSAGDLAFALMSLSGLGNGGSGLFFSRFRRPWAAGTAIALAVAALAVAAVAWRVSRDYAASQITEFQRLTFQRGYIISARFAPDGQNLLYAAAWNGQPFEIFMTRPGGLESRPLGLKDATLLGVSEGGEMAILVDQRMVTHWIQSGTLARIPLEGGAPRRMIDHVNDGDIRRDGREFAVVRTVDGRQRLEYPVGKVLVQTDGYISHPKISPGGDTVAFLDHPIYGDDRGFVSIVDLQGKVRRLTPEWGSCEGLAWRPGGRELWFAAISKDLHKLIYAVGLDGRLREVWRGPVDAMVHDIAPDGRLLLTREDVTSQMLGWREGAAAETNLTWLGWTLASALSPDGRSVGFSEYNVDPSTDYYACTRPLDGSPPVRLGEGVTLCFSPDASKIVSVIPGKPGNLHILSTGAGDQRAIDLHGVQARTLRGAWSPDGLWIYFSGVSPGSRTRTYRVPASGGAPEPVTQEGEWGGLLSPDGGALIVEDRAGRHKLLDLRNGATRPIAGLAAGESPIDWDARGESLWVRERGAFPFSIVRLNPVSGRRETHLTLKPVDPAGMLSVPGIVISRAGDSYAYNVVRILSDLYVASGLR